MVKLQKLLLLTFVLSCTHLGAQEDTLKRAGVAREKTLSQYFDTTAYRYIFLMGQYTEADSIWALDSSREVLERIVSEDRFSKRSAFFAAEILFDHCDWRPEGKLKTRVAGIYADALRDNYTRTGNPWGYPPATGDIGDHLLDFGEVLVIAFKPLLKCDAPVRYEGSGIALTLSLERKYRVKDIAASYICAVRHMKFDATQDQKGRDKQIKKIRRKI